MKRTYHILIELDIQDIVQAFEQRNLPPTRDNLKRLRRALETVARDAANTFLVQFAANKATLVERTSESEV